MKKALFALLLTLATFGLQAQMFDPVHWAFSVRYPSDTTAELVMSATIDPSWHIYSQHTSPDGPLPMEFQFNASDSYALVGEVQESKSKEEMDEVFGVMVKSFEGKAQFVQRIVRKSTSDFTVEGLFSYQSCSDANGTCLAPEYKDLSFKVKGAVRQASAAIPSPTPSDEEEKVALAEADTQAAPTASLEAAPEPTAPSASEPDEEAEHHTLWGFFWIALGAGILTMFTPCVFPMIPMTVNYFMRGAENKRKARQQALFFGLSIVFIFAVLGVLLSFIFGPERLNTIATNWIPNLIFFAIFMVFALSFFGLFEIKMPERWVNSSDEQADKGGFLAPFFIALTTVLVSFSCTGPIIASALAELTTAAGADAETANRWVSLISLLGFGIGFAAPFTLLAFFPQFLKKMKSGSWLNTVKVSFAFIEVAFGLKFLQMADIDRNWGLLPRDIYLALWIVIFALWGFYLLGKLRFKGDDEVTHLGAGRLFIAIADLAFVVYMIPGLWGAELKGLSGFLPPATSQQFSIPKLLNEYTPTAYSSATTPSPNAALVLPTDRKYAEQLAHHTPLGFQAFFDLDEAKAYARSVGKPVFVDFTGKNCANCREMEQYVWPDPEVRHLLNTEFVMVSLYCDENTITLPESEWVTDDKGHTLKTLGRRNGFYERINFKANAQPYYILLDADGNLLTTSNFQYTRNVSKFVEWLNEGLRTYRQNHAN